jgi:hypothetical protein
MIDAAQRAIQDLIDFKCGQAAEIQEELKSLWDMYAKLGNFEIDKSIPKHNWVGIHIEEIKND